MNRKLLVSHLLIVKKQEGMLKKLFAQQPNWLP
jgi:hypothetical protein